MLINRGLFALVLTLLLSTTLYSKYIYVDEVIDNPRFNSDIEAMGEDLYKHTGINLYLAIIHELENNQSIVDYEKNLMSELEQPAIILSFSEMDSRVDILARPESLYEHFDMRQVLAPVISPFQAFFLGLFFSNSWDEFVENIQGSGGSIIPLLSQKAKGKDITSKYSVALFNGYADIAEQIAESKGVHLDKEIGNTNRIFIGGVKVVFYGIILLAIMRYIYIKIRYKKRKDDEEQ